MRILIADALPPGATRRLTERGHQVEHAPQLTVDELAGAIAGHEVLVVRSTRVGADVFAAADRLALVVRAGAGTNTIDTAAAASCGVLVANVPGRNAAAVAELTIGLLLAIDRRIPEAVADLRAGRWDKKGYSEAAGLLGSTLGIVGLGSIGVCVAERAAAFGMRVQAVAKRRAPHVEDAVARLGIVLQPTLEQLVASSDVVSLHLPSGDGTRGLVDRSFLDRMRDGAVLLNTSRGDVVDETALLEALDAGRLRAGLDVYADEPGSGRAEWSSSLGRHPRVVGTHHIGASTRQAQEATADGVVEVIDAFVEGRAPNCVNLERRRLGSMSLHVRHLDRPGVLAHVLALLSHAGLNVEHMENRVLSGGGTAVACIDVGGTLTDQVLEELDALEHVLGVTALPLTVQDVAT